MSDNTQAIIKEYEKRLADISAKLDNNPKGFIVRRAYSPVGLRESSNPSSRVFTTHAERFRVFDDEEQARSEADYVSLKTQNRYVVMSFRDALEVQRIHVVRALYEWRKLSEVF